MGTALKSIPIEAPYQATSLTLSKRRLGRTELMVSPIGFGSLRLTPEDGLYKDTLLRALESGVHFIDTSGTYGNGASEMVIGEVLRDYLYNHPELNNEVVLCTKIGIVQGAAFQEMKQYRRPSYGMFSLNDKLGYCLSPEFIESQLTLSLRRLQRECVSIVLIQNPEYLLKEAKNKKEFLMQLRRAFEHLEVEVARGRIKHYGISSSSFLKKEIDPFFLDVREIVELAESISKKHHFSVTQIPFNLFETAPLFYTNQDKMSFFAAAKKFDLGILTCRPLTSHHRDKVHHFITFPGKDEASVKGKLHKSLMEVVELEKQLESKGQSDPNLRWGHNLRHHLHSINDWWKWSVYLQKEVLPSIQDGIATLPDTIEWNQWKVNYVNHLHDLFNWITDSLQGIANLRTNQICHYLNKESQVLQDENKLSNKVTRIYLALPEIHSIVMGLSNPQHVEDLLSLGEIPTEQASLEILEKVKMHF